MALASLAALTLYSTLSLALRSPSRAKIAEAFERIGRADRFNRFATLESHFLLATAIVRSGAVLLLLIAVLYAGEARADEVTLGHTAATCAVAWVALLIFGVGIPHAWEKYAGDWLIVRCWVVLEVTRWVCRPLIVVMEVFDPLVRRLAGVPAPDAQSVADEMEQEILTVVSEGELHGAVDEEEKEMIESVIELGDMRVSEIMTPRTEIVALPADADFQTVLTTIRDEGHSRIPVFEENVDTVLGVLYAKDLLGRDAATPLDLRTVLRKPLFVPESKRVPDLLAELKRQKVHIAIVLDEYGGTAGLVTLEDIIEELVGDLADEYETPEPAEYKKVDDHTYEIDARMRIDDLGDQLDIELPDNEDYETLGGFVFSTLGKIPKVGETCRHGNVAIKVIGAEPRRVTRLLLKITPGANRSDGEG